MLSILSSPWPVLLSFALGCQGPSKESPADDSPEESGQDSQLEGLFAYGDPITTLGTEGVNGGPEVPEWMDAAILDDEHGYLVGQGGSAVVSLSDGQIVTRLQGQRGYRVATDGPLAFVATRDQGLQRWDFTNMSDPQTGPRVQVSDGYHEDIAADAGRVLLAAQEHGALVLTDTFQVVNTLPSDFALAVAIQGRRALVADREELVLWDVADLSALVELDRVALPGPGRDLSFDGERVAVALGGLGARVFDLENDQLVQRDGTLLLPGSVFSVSLDGDHLWLAGWTVVGVAWLGEGGPLMIGHESPVSQAMGVAARDGRAVVADWLFTTAMQLNPGVAGGEVQLVTRREVATDLEELRVDLRNWGALPLSMTFDAENLELRSEATMELAPGEVKPLVLGVNGGGTVTWTSDDPDELEGRFEVGIVDLQVGAQHPDFSLPGFDWPAPEPRDYTLSEQLGKVVVLDYWATW